MIDADAVAAKFGLGAVIDVREVRGGLLNRMWRVASLSDVYAVKEINHERDWPCDFAAVDRLERAAFAAGLPMPEPVASDREVVVHRWVDGDRVPEEPVPAGFARAVGAFLSRLHVLDVPAPPAAGGQPMPGRDEWVHLAVAAQEAGVDWAVSLAAAVDVFAEMGALVDVWSQREDVMALTHRDVSQKNLLAVASRPVVLDWEASGVMPLVHELGATGVNLASDNGFNRFEPSVFRAFVDGYGAAPAPGPHWFTAWFSSWTWFLRWNVRRCLEHGEPRDDVVRRGLLEIPRSFAMLDELAALTG